VFYTDGKLQYTVRVDAPNPLFARQLQQAIGGVEGEIRVSMQYFFQAWGQRAPKKYRDLLLNTATEEIAHIEMLATAVSLNLEGATAGAKAGVSVKEPSTQALLGGMLQRHYLSTGQAAMPVDSDGIPFDMSHVYASGNLMADMYANVAAEATGRVLATRLYNMTDDPGMKDMLKFLIARDTMHQQQWLAVIEELGGAQGLPIPDSFPQSEEHQEFSYAFISTSTQDGPPPPEGRWSSGPSIDGRSEFHTELARPYGEEPILSRAPAEAYLQKRQYEDDVPEKSPQVKGNHMVPEQQGGGMMEKVKDKLS
jgi:Mn-containing catalase